MQPKKSNIIPEFPGSNQEFSNITKIKRGIWLYFLLLLFEGALRKWIFPSIATPLLLIRDPLAFWIVFQSWKFGYFPRNVYVTIVVVIGTIATFTALFLGHSNLIIALFGARILLIHFPMMFAIGYVFRYEDVVKVGKAVVIIAIPMSVLVTFQFYSPQTSWVNWGVGADKLGAGYSGALGYFRPPATFSFTNGTHLFFGLTACFILYFWTQSKLINRIYLLTATFGLLLTIPFSISRSLLLYVSLALGFTVIASFSNRKSFVRMSATLLVMFFAFIFLSNTPFLKTGIDAFSRRFTDASSIEGGLSGSIGNRFLGGLVNDILNSDQVPFLGYGIGMGTNVGSMLLAGKTGFLIAEEEWGRLIGEMGAIMGISIILVRLCFLLEIGIESYKCIKIGNILPWILMSNAILTISQGQWAQPTALGFSTLVGGLIIASTKRKLSNQVAPMEAE